MSDGTLLLVFVALSCLSAAALSALLAKRRSFWSQRKRSLLAALPLPGIAALLCLWVFGKAWIAQLFSEESCGVDACGMAIMFSSIALFWISVVYVLAVISAAVCTRLAKPSATDSDNDLLE